MRWPPIRLPRSVVAVWVWWTAAGVFFITRESLMRLFRGERVPWVPVSFAWMASVYIWAALTPAILWAGRRWPIDADGPGRWRHVAVHAGLSALLSAGASIVEAPVLVALGASPLPGASWRALVPVLLAYTFHGGVIQYLGRRGDSGRCCGPASGPWRASAKRSSCRWAARSWRGN